MENVRCFTARIDGAALDGFSFGSGKEQMVILPGMSLRSVVLSAEGVANAYASFGERFTVTVFERRQKMPAGFTTREMADDVAAAMESLSIRNACVFAASQGGMIAQYLAARHPELVGKLVLASSCAAPSASAVEIFSRWHVLAEAGDTVSLNRDFTARCYCDATKKAFADFFASSEKDGTPEDLLRFQPSCDASASHNARGILGKISCPTLVIGSSGDEVLGSEGSRELAASIPGARLIMLDGYGHAVYDEYPGYKQLLADFFAE